MTSGNIAAMTCLVFATLLACARSPAPTTPHEEPESTRVALPRTHEECRAAGGEVEPKGRGGRCFTYYTPRRDGAAYTACRGGGGIPRVEGPGRSVADPSHVCTLVFLPEI